MATRIRRFKHNEDLSDLVVLSKAFFKEYEEHHEELFKVGRLRKSDIIAFFNLPDYRGSKGATFVAVDKGRIVG